jgi:hypothetical protein
MSDQSQSIPPNAFRSLFLSSLTERDGPITAGEAEFSGPWRVEPQGGRYAVLKGWEESAAGDTPFATMQHPETAAILSAILPAFGREPLFYLDPDGNSETGFRILASFGEQGQREVGRLSKYETGVVEALHVAEYLARNPLALATVLLASGPWAVLEIGRILFRQVSDPPAL